MQLELDKILKLVTTLFSNQYIGHLKKHSHCLLTLVTTSIFNIPATLGQALLMITFILVSELLLWKAVNWKEVVRSLQTPLFLLVQEFQRTHFGLETQLNSLKILSLFKAELLEMNQTQLSKLLSNDSIKSYHFHLIIFITNHSTIATYNLKHNQHFI